MEVVQFDSAWELKILKSKKVDGLFLSQKFCIGASEGEALSRQRLESGFDTHVWVNLREKLCSDVSASVVSDGRHDTLWAAESVVNTKRLTTWAVLGSSTTAKSGLSSCLAGPTRGDGTVDVGGVLIANSLAGKRLSSATPGSPLHLPSVVPAMGSVASTKGLGSFEGWGSGWLAGGVTPEAPQAGAPPKCSHLPLWLGVQFVHGTPLRTYEHPTQRPLPLHRQHCGGTLASEKPTYSQSANYSTCTYTQASVLKWDKYSARFAW